MICCRRIEALEAVIGKARMERDAAEERWLELAEQVELLAGLDALRGRVNLNRHAEFISASSDELRCRGRTGP